MNKTLPLNHSIFDTNLTQGFSLIKTKQKFVLRNYVDREGKSIIYLIISDKKNRVRINTGISVNKKYWDDKKQRIERVRFTK